MRRKLAKVKLEVYQRKKEGQSIRSLSQEYGMDTSDIVYLVRLINAYGTEIITDKHRVYSSEFKTSVVEEYLADGVSYNDISIKYALPNSSILKQWVKTYKESGCVILDKKRGRASMKEKKTEIDKPLEEMTAEEQIEYWKKRAIRAEAEAEYLKKLEAVVQAREARQQKKK